MKLDTFTQNHFDTWIKYTIHEDEQDKVKKMILSFLNEYPELLEDHSWPEIRSLAERRMDKQ